MEPLFKEWKRTYRLADMPSSKKGMVEALLRASLRTFVASRRLLDALSTLAGQAERLEPGRWAAVFESVAPKLLVVVLHPPRLVRYIGRRITDTLLHEAVDPNASRPALLEAVETGVHRFPARKVKTP